MAASASLHKRKTLLLVLLFIVFSTFSADILDLREELHILSCPYSCLDNNVSTGLTGFDSCAPEPILASCSVQQKVSVKVSFLHLLPYGYRAPPRWS